MKTKKALGALLGLLGSLPAFPFLPLAGFSAPLLFTANLNEATRRTEKKKESQKHVATRRNRTVSVAAEQICPKTIEKTRERRRDSYLASALAAPLDLAPFMADSCGDNRGSGQIRSNRAERRRFGSGAGRLTWTGGDAERGGQAWPWEGKGRRQGEAGAEGRG